MGNRESTQTSPHTGRISPAEARLEAKSTAQGGRWMDSEVVAGEPKYGYGVKHHHERQNDQPEVKAAAQMADSVDTAAAAERLNLARASAQGGRWLDSENTPKGAATQKQQPEVHRMVEAAKDPAWLKKVAAEEAARRKACGGRW